MATKVEDPEKANPEKVSKKEKKGKKKEKKGKKEKKNKSIVSRILKLIIILGILGFIVGVLVFNIFNIRDRYLSGILSNIPFINTLISNDEIEDDDNLEFVSREELINQVEELRLRLSEKENEIQKLENNEIINLSEIERLSELEAQQEQFRIDREAFDELIALNDPNAFISFYESINPESASRLYEQAIISAQTEEELRNYIANFRNMETASAASILEEMIVTDMDLVILILNNLDNRTSGAVLSEMTPQNAATVAKMMAP